MNFFAQVNVNVLSKQKKWQMLYAFAKMVNVIQFFFFLNSYTLLNVYNTYHFCIYNVIYITITI